jgi:hypothetical protein
MSDSSQKGPVSWTNVLLRLKGAVSAAASVELLGFDLGVGAGGFGVGGRDRRHLVARRATAPAGEPRRGRASAGSRAGRGAAGGLLGAVASRASAYGAGQGRGPGAAVAGPQRRRGVRLRLPLLEGRRQGDRARAGGVWETHLPHLSQAGCFGSLSSTLNPNKKL